MMAASAMQTAAMQAPGRSWPASSGAGPSTRRWPRPSRSPTWCSAPRCGHRPGAHGGRRLRHRHRGAGVRLRLGVLLALPAAVLAGLSFGLPMTAFTATVENVGAPDRCSASGSSRCSCSRVPSSPSPQLPAGGGRRPVLPLWHGVELARAAAFGTRPPARRRPRRGTPGLRARRGLVARSTSRRGWCHDPATPPRRAASGPRARHLLERNLLVYGRWARHRVRGLRTRLLPVRRRRGPGRLVGDVTGPGGAPVTTRVRRPGPAGRLRDERRGVRVDHQHLLQAQAGEGLRRRARHPDAPGDVAVGEIVCSLMRGVLYAVAFLGDRHAWPAGPVHLGALPAVPAALLIGSAFAASGWRARPSCGRGRTST